MGSIFFILSSRALTEDPGTLTHEDEDYDVMCVSVTYVSSEFILFLSCN